jgi:hypothetical protein
VGDIHSGKQACTQSYDQGIYDQFTGLADPLVYTPGDNEWTDCRKTAQGGGLKFSSGDWVDYQVGDHTGGDPLDNLDLVRSLFFATPGQTLGAPIGALAGVDRRSCTPVGCQLRRERDLGAVRRRVRDDQIFPAARTTIKTRGSALGPRANGSAPSGSSAPPPTCVGSTERSRWRKTAARRMSSSSSRPTCGASRRPRHESGYEPIVKSIARHAADLGGPVPDINGDSHKYRSDSPLSRRGSCVTETSPTTVGTCAFTTWDRHPYYNVPNFHRIVVHGSSLPLEYLRLVIDPSADARNGANAFGPFSWERVPQI